ncbi:hypothetical protein [Otariodibacter oris]|uniref:Uncharacterized protein n=1 Tax=Otariodibacter oris TaxID=1032623 RepID=A0A420XIP0_9PAST|nr:hypothetical protein [Otariodibacter oris]QGM80605.1 hypothetical protein A6A10_03910 [Otariodibacter oris]RKR77237.1 hypothetical protein DES31_0564 [Otariodibacter oris]
MKSKPKGKLIFRLFMISLIIYVTFLLADLGLFVYYYFSGENVVWNNYIFWYTLKRSYGAIIAIWLAEIFFTLINN